jgi:uncharacterized protein (DUF58 family)
MNTAALAAPPPRRRNPLAVWRQRLGQWWASRQPRSDLHLLTQRNVYILPTRAGFMFALTLLTLLLASINYQLNLGYVLTFLLAGSGVVSMHLTHNTLRGLRLHLKPVQPVFAGEAALIEVVLTAPAGDRRARHGIGLQCVVDGEAPASPVWVDVPAGGQVQAHIGVVLPSRGLHRLPTLTASTRFPLGLFRAWTVWRPAASCLAYPKPEHPAAPLPAGEAVSGAAQRHRASAGGETEGVRGYRRGDPPKLIVWKKAAKLLDSGGDLLSRDTHSAARQQLVLGWQAAGGGSTEERLSRLAAWVLRADQLGLPYGLNLPGVERAPDLGDAHRRACLEALALWT